MYELLWFFGGILTYRLLAFLLNYGYLLIFVKEINMLGMTLLASIVDDLTLIKKLKYKILEESNIDEESIKMFKLSDEQIMEAWKGVAISKFTAVWPKKFHAASTPKTWEEAMTAVNDHYKEQIWK